jgi:hypothetical protein
MSVAAQPAGPLTRGISINIDLLFMKQACGLLLHQGSKLYDSTIIK